MIDYKKGMRRFAIAASVAFGPSMWFVILVIAFSVELNWLPAMGMAQDVSLFSFEAARHMVLPVLALAAIPAAIVARTTRAAVLEILSQEFVEAQRAKGLSESRILWHVVKNALPTMLAVMGLQLGYLLGGSILIETVFSWPGTGFLLNQAIFQRDLPLLQGSILVLALFFVLLNLLVDVMQTLLDPRIARQ